MRADDKLKMTDVKTEGYQIYVTIVTVCYNSAETIRKTIESVLKQSYPHIEYLIIDGKSTDLTVVIAKEYKEKFKAQGYKYSIKSEPDKNIYDAMNKGIKFSTGELIGFINAGDWYEQDAVATAVMEYTNKYYDYFYADINIVRPNGKNILKHSKIDVFPTSRHWNHPTSFARCELYDELGHFNCEGIHEDFDFFLRVRKAGKKISIENVVLANFVTGGISNKKSLKMCRQRVLDRYKCYRRNGYSPFYFFECVCIEIIKYLVE